MERSHQGYDANAIRRGQWTADEDQKLLSYIQQHGPGNWSLLPQKAGLKRCGRSCRLRWTNYLSPDIKRGNFSLNEEKTIIQLHALLGNRWSAIAMHLPKRTDSEIKNHWNVHLKKRLAMSGIDPVTHKSRILTLGSTNACDSKNVANLNHVAQWESVRLEAEARSVRESKLHQNEQLAAASSELHNNMGAGSYAPPPRCLDVLTAWRNIVANSIISKTNYGLGNGFSSGNADLEWLTCSLNDADMVEYDGESNDDQTSSRQQYSGLRGGEQQHIAEEDMNVIWDMGEELYGTHLWNEIYDDLVMFVL